MTIPVETRQKCRKFLGFSGRFLNIDTELEQAMQQVSDAFLEADIDDAIADIERVDGKVRAAEDRTKFERVEDVYYAKGELVNLRGQGRMFVGRLAALLGVKPRADYFGSSAPLGAVMKQG